MDDACHTSEAANLSSCFEIAIKACRMPKSGCLKLANGRNKPSGKISGETMADSAQEIADGMTGVGSGSGQKRVTRQRLCFCLIPMRAAGWGFLHLG